MVRWLLLLQEFNLQIVDRRGTSNQVTDYLSWLEDVVFSPEEKQSEINDQFPNEKLFQVDTRESLLRSDIETRDISEIIELSGQIFNSLFVITFRL